MAWSPVWWSPWERLLLVVGFRIHPDSHRPPENFIFFTDGNALLTAIGMPINSVFFVHSRRELLPMRLVRFSSLADFGYQVVIEEELSCMRSLSIAEQDTLLNGDVSIVNSNVDMSASTVIPARHDGIELRDTLLVCLLNASEPSRVFNWIATFHEFQ